MTAGTRGRAQAHALGERRAIRLASRFAWLALAASLGACSLFGPDRPKPKPLEPITAPITARQLWNQNIGSVQFPMTVAVNGGTLTAAASDGTVLAVEAESGKVLWRASVGSKLSAGVGSDGTVAAVVTREGELVALQAGQVKWRKTLGARVATAPLVAGGRVFVLGVDRAVQAYDAQDGAKIWQMQRAGDPLTLAFSGVIAAFKNTLVVGQGPRLAGIDPISSSVRWEVPIGSPRGANEVERLADLIGPALRTGDLFCARSFQAAVGCVDAERGRIVWTKTVGGNDAIGGDSELVFGADASDRITAWKTPDGRVAWSTEALLNRGLGAPAVIGTSVVFGDRDGTLHWLSRAKGEAQLRSSTDGSVIAVPPVVVGGVLVVVTRSGGMFAFRPS
ncbi:MAG: outer membrane protein assembly factor BamB [Caldimonas sp.]|nr:outer membrane protein assembly factor BamB [Pseudomonadota bacterium]